MNFVRCVCLLHLCFNDRHIRDALSEWILWFSEESIYWLVWLIHVWAVLWTATHATCVQFLCTPHFGIRKGVALKLCNAVTKMIHFPGKFECLNSEMQNVRKFYFVMFLLRVQRQPGVVGSRNKLGQIYSYGKSWCHTQGIWQFIAAVCYCMTIVSLVISRAPASQQKRCDSVHSRMLL